MAEGITYLCPSCGAYLRYDGGQGKWVCDYCDSSYTKEELDMYEKDSGLYYGTFDFEDTVIGRDYRALVGVYAERNGGGDLRSVYTNEVTAKR